MKILILNLCREWIDPFNQSVAQLLIRADPPHLSNLKHIECRSFFQPPKQNDSACVSMLRRTSKGSSMCLRPTWWEEHLEQGSLRNLMWETISEIQDCVGQLPIDPATRSVPTSALSPSTSANFEKDGEGRTEIEDFLWSFGMTSFVAFMGSSCGVRHQSPNQSELNLIQTELEP